MVIVRQWAGGLWQAIRCYTAGFERLIMIGDTVSEPVPACADGSAVVAAYHQANAIAEF
jgi:hypothetical protein